ncbi:hypothetical protein K501DRAFT_268016 [Backusella circina FSU 941]|nr:hypothetical protein K501DRAFT_268016 [Backusella circina FSU 941]
MTFLRIHKDFSHFFITESHMSNNYIAFGLASSVGPIIAGVLSDKLSWRYIFWLNSILAALVATIIYLLLEIPTKPEQKVSPKNLKTLFSRIDFGGCVIAAIGIAGLLLGMNFGSGALQYDWSSPIVIGLLIAASVLGLVFILYEKFVSSAPLFPSRIITDRDMALLYIHQFINGIFYITLILTPIITYQSVFNDTPTGASLKLLPAVVMFIISTIAQPSIPAIITGNIVIVLATILLAFVENEHSNVGVQIGFMILFTAGLGQTNQSTLIASQLVLESKAPEMIATSLVLIRFLVQVGVTIGAAIFLTIIKVGVKTNLESVHETAPNVYQSIIATDAITNYVKIGLIKDDLIRGTLNSIYFKSISLSLYVPIAASIIALLCSIFVNIPKIGEVKKSKGTESIDG